MSYLLASIFGLFKRQALLLKTPCAPEKFSLCDLAFHSFLWSVTSLDFLGLLRNWWGNKQWGPRESKAWDEPRLQAWICICHFGSTFRRGLAFDDHKSELLSKGIACSFKPVCQRRIDSRGKTQSSQRVNVYYSQNPTQHVPLLKLGQAGHPTLVSFLPGVASLAWKN